MHEPQRLKRIKRGCFGCGDAFTTYQRDNYDYCRFCAINGNRCVVKKSPCAECGDGSGIIRFAKQKSRLCKLCILTKRKINCLYKCAFAAYHNQVMENHYQQKHYPKAKEVKRA
ncbi:MAG: hypothetical protein MRECE_2c047 [Mycoplasmataceae bacterium CE_OT135]|nr:MAG: hypothetical protein MRECE_2c047 [Mycoplasmataceae bacterium CE_OT135]